MKTCEDCKFYSPTGDVEESGQCRINPPVPVGMNVSSGPEHPVDFRTVWPSVWPDIDWCGHLSEK